MTIRNNIILAGLAATCIYFSAATAHHSHGNYEMTEYTHLEGTVMELHWMNPHTWIYLCLLYTSPSPRDATLSRMPSCA